MGIYAKDMETDALLEMYFEEDEEIKIYKESMSELFEEETTEYLSEANKEEKEAKKQEKLEERIEKAKEKIAKKINNIVTQYKNYKSFELDVHVATPKERAMYLAHNAAAAGTMGAAYTAGSLAGATASGATKAAIARSGAKNVAKHVAKATAHNVATFAIIAASAVLINELIKNKRFKDVYSVKLYGIKEDGTRQLVKWWTSVKVDVSDLDSSVRSKVKKVSK